MNYGPVRALSSSKAYQTGYMPLATLPPEAVYRANGPDLSTKFYSRLRSWRHAIHYQSSATRILSHPDFRAIVEMGEAAVPLIVQEIATQPDLLVAALREITGQDPVPAEERGNLTKMAARWLAWYERR